MWLSHTPLNFNPAQPSDQDPDLPFVQLVHMLGLSALDAYILILCLAPELDRRYERLYAYLQDNVIERLPTINLMMNLLGQTLEERFEVRARFQPDMPLRQHMLVEVLPDPSHHRPGFLAHQIKLDHRIAAFLLGDYVFDERLKGILQEEDVRQPIPMPRRVPDLFLKAMPDAPMIHLYGRPGVGRRASAAGLCGVAGWALLGLDAEAITRLERPFERSWKLALREARLRGAAFMMYEWDSILDEQGRAPAEFWQALEAFENPVFLIGQQPWEPPGTERPRRLLRLKLDMPDYEERQGFWLQALHHNGVALPDETLTALASKYQFSPLQIRSAVETAVDLALSRGENLILEDLLAGAQSHSSLRLGNLARRIRPTHTWDDLILPPDPMKQLEEMTARARFVHIVQHQWGYGRKIAPTPGVSALFAGQSGTGKTMAAEVIANDLGLVLYKIDLSAVVSKYIGETEKNLGTIFDEAQSSNAILFFDEADALFGKRSEVKDARDRYANIEIAYLLQKIEGYDGIAIMATNLRQNLDEAFTRRIDFMVEFPFPEDSYRERIWAAHIPAEAPLSDSVSLEELAARYPLAGGNIRNASVAAAYLAAADGGVISRAHLRSAIRREYQKMGRLIDETI